jgi:hypothetical protein
MSQQSQPLAPNDAAEDHSNVQQAAQADFF